MKHLGLVLKKIKTRTELQVLLSSHDGKLTQQVRDWNVNLPYQHLRSFKEKKIIYLCMYFPENILLYELTFRNFFTYIEVTVTTEEFTLLYNLT